MSETQFIRTLLLVSLTTIFSTSCGYLFGPGDCGYQARLKKSDSGNNVEIRVARVTAETVGSVTSCGYSYIWTRAAKIELRGSALSESIGPNRMQDTYVNRSDQGGVDYYYEAPANFDPRKDIISLETRDGSTYKSRPETTEEHSSGSMDVDLK